MPKKHLIISFSLSLSVLRALSISFDRDSLISSLSATGESSFGSTSRRLLSSPSTKGASTEMWRPDALSESAILSTGMSSSSESSSGEGRRSFSCSNLARALLILFMEPTWLSGSLTIRDCSARACRIDCLIHHTAYDMNLKPLVSSKRSAAFISPRLPSFIRSGKLNPWF